MTAARVGAPLVNAEALKVKISAASDAPVVCPTMRADCLIADAAAARARGVALKIA
ncbi:MAG: hypothetical protein JO104_08510, partial [Candidatus Eremiobacteraeota bacterium]|nr:hypothetical protein [Candidatus Eremiobacteraeota bacterium]